tara:strand:+ start:333 stop:719 length:387 start_codon:yes stop_codon:yes gene_type:complete
MTDSQKNVLGTPLRACCMQPITGFTRNGFCELHPDDQGLHTVCVIVTDAFLAFSKSKGNDLSTPFPEYQFPGLKEGDKWCLCALRWKEAYEANVAPKIVISATHESVLEIIDLEVLKQYAIDHVNQSF